MSSSLSSFSAHQSNILVGFHRGHPVVNFEPIDLRPLALIPVFPSTMESSGQSPTYAL